MGFSRWVLFLIKILLITALLNSPKYDSNEPETVTANQTVSSTEYTVPRQNSFQRIHLGIKSVPLEHTFGWMKLTPQSLNTLDPTTNASIVHETPTTNETSAEIVDSDIQYAYQENKAEPVQLESYTFDLDSESSEPVQSDEPQVIKETLNAPNPSQKNLEYCLKEQGQLSLT